MPPPLHSRRPRPQDFDRQRWDRLHKLPRTAKTAFLFAVYDDDGPKLRELVAAGTPTSTSATPYSALRSGALKALLERVADSNGCGLDKKATALHHPGGPVYVNNGPERHFHETGIRMLLDHGASVLERDTESNTPLHYAAFGSNVRCFRLLASKLPRDADASIVNLKRL
ncbi:uncharacterized protein BBA_02783 [Beauveria bassiana ARSEF 2860]|uniref:Uncharacterized protein n=1 Tax=Beauveria bassiana (strain ARSEF 2860) TaxID=655819 RepID=J4UR15_BEAB2|nr:uncharacterized protein BBA_02783 [Beauveria bassiana ARSEF 2860]EJP67887.1 hypothetical protein BBA_02783 [Beauveria bassiana ARSEF 2860]